MASTPFPGRFSRVQQPAGIDPNQQQVADQSDEFRKKYAAGVDAPEEAGAQQDDMLPHWEKPGTQEGYIGVGPGAGSASGSQFESELASTPRFASASPPVHLLSDAELDTAIGDARHAGDAQRVNELQQEAISRTRSADDSYATR